MFIYLPTKNIELPKLIKAISEIEYHISGLVPKDQEIEIRVQDFQLKLGFKKKGRIEYLALQLYNNIPSTAFEAIDNKLTELEFKRIS